MRQDRVVVRHPPSQPQSLRRFELRGQLDALALCGTTVGEVVLAARRVGERKLNTAPVDVIERSVDRDMSVEEIGFETQLVVLGPVRLEVLRDPGEVCRIDAPGTITR